MSQSDVVVTSVEHQLDAIAPGAFHRKVAWLIGAGMFIDGFNLYMLSPVLAAFVASGFSSVAFNATILFYNFLGLAIGSLLSGLVTDYFGRQKMYQINLLTFGIASLLAALSPSVTWFTAFRFIIGVALGGEIITGYATLAEFVPPERRGKNGNLLNTLVSLGQPASAFVGLALLPVWGWRGMFALIGVAGLLVWGLRHALPESPRWLARKGRLELAQTIVEGIARDESLWALRRRAQELARKNSPGASPSGAPSTQKVPWTVLFRGRLLSHTVIAVLLQCVQLCVVFGFLSWVPTLLVAEHFTLIHSLFYTALMGLGLPIGGLLGLLFADSLGRKAVMIGSGLLGAVFGVAYGFSLHSGPEVVMLLGFLTEVMIMGFGGVSIATYVPELFPTEVRATGGGFAVAVGRVASAVFPFAVVAVFHHLGAHWVFLMIAATLLLGVITAALGPETRRRSLEEIVRLPG
ncbi:MAG: MFS transporter [Firmicutes bacterium]|nr:MFS transporter [Bacillota bacterium]